MSIQSEKENINKIRERIERIEALRMQMDAEYDEINALLRKRYNLMSDRADVDLFKAAIIYTRPHWIDLKSVRAMIEEDRIFFDRTSRSPVNILNDRELMGNE